MQKNEQYSSIKQVTTSLVALSQGSDEQGAESKLTTKYYNSDVHHCSWAQVVFMVLFKWLWWVPYGSVVFLPSRVTW